MKRTIYLTASILVILSVANLAKAQVLWRGAKTMKKGSFIAMGEVYNMDYSKKYINSDWQSNPSDQSNFGFEFMFGYALSDRWEVMLHAPLYFKSSPVNNVKEKSSGIGDAYFKTRYALVPWAKDKHGITLVGSLRLPSGSDNKQSTFLNLGDGTTDIGLGGMLTTKWFNKFKGHVKLNYWINGKTDADVNKGDEMKLILKLDHNLSKKFMPFVTFIHYKVFENKDADGNKIAGSNKSRNYFVIGTVYKPKAGLFLRPKLSFFMGGKNGVIFNVKPIFDMWYVF